MPSNIYKSEPAIGKSEKGQANGVATLDANGLVPGSQLDIVNALDSTSTDKPLSAAQGKALNDQIGNIATSADIGTFSTQSGLDSALDTVLSNTVSNGVKSFQFSTSAAFGMFDNGATYLCTLYKSGSNTTFSHANFRTVSSVKEIVGRRTGTGWSYAENAIKSDIAVTASRQVEAVGLSPSASKVITLSNIESNRAYMIMLTGANPAGWHYVGMLCNGAQYQALIALESVGVTLSLSGNSLTITNNSTYTLNGNVTIIG